MKDIRKRGTYLGESTVRYSRKADKSGAYVALPKTVLANMNLQPEHDVVIWFELDGQVVPVKKRNP